MINTLKRLRRVLRAKILNSLNNPYPVHSLKDNVQLTAAQIDIAHQIREEAWNSVVNREQYVSSDPVPVFQTSC